MMDVGCKIEAGLAGVLAEGGFHERDIGTVDFAVTVDVSGHLRHEGYRICRCVDFDVAGLVLGGAVKPVSVAKRTGERHLSRRWKRGYMAHGLG